MQRLNTYALDAPGAPNSIALSTEQSRCLYVPRALVNSAGALPIFAFRLLAPTANGILVATVMPTGRLTRLALEVKTVSFP